MTSTTAQQNIIFKKCNHCQKVWNNYKEFLSDPDTKIIGYQVSFEDLKAGLFLFNHSCSSTIGLPVGAFTHLYDGPIFEERATGTDRCPEYCLYDYELAP